jgi:hypothetical protein
MKLAVLILASSLIISTTTKAIPEAPTPKVEGEPKPAAARLDKRVFLTGTILLAAAQAADLTTTRQCLDRGACHEMDPLYGARYPSAERQAGLGIVYFTTRVALFYFTEKSQNRFVRWAGRTMMVGFTVGHAVEAEKGATVRPN